ncbi:hypothetical protein F5B17DRAFT_453289 [Nemania serpens]|nr:hypothetical protein F5B17DRAFT_453289 [Nemania serpens]
MSVYVSYLLLRQDPSQLPAGALPPSLTIDPPLFNSANPWATTLEHLRALYACPATGAVTTRTALLEDGFPHDEGTHRFALFETRGHRVGFGGTDGGGGGGDVRGMEGEGDRDGDGDGEGGVNADASLNTLGYSPIPLAGYMGFIERINEEEEEKKIKTETKTEGNTKRKSKPFIVSVTGSPDEVAECYRRVAALATRVAMPIAVEVNLSCPNIAGHPPPAYEAEALRAYVARIAAVAAEGEGRMGGRVPWGLKTPPYTHAGQFEMFVSVLRGSALSLSPSVGNRDGDGDGDGDGDSGVCPVSFVTATNTLGSCLLLAESESDGGNRTVLAPALPGLGIGGVAGAPLHPLALGNVATLRRLLDAAPETRHVAVLGIGGVADAAGYRRMRSVGAAAVGVGTALGIRGVGVFGEIQEGLGGG